MAISIGALRIPDRLHHERRRERTESGRRLETV
jgi:hypothetical protein